MKTVVYIFLPILMILNSSNIGAQSQSRARTIQVADGNTTGGKIMGSHYEDGNGERQDHQAGPANQQRKHLSTISYRAASFTPEYSGQGKKTKSHHDTHKAIINNMKAYHQQDTSTSGKRFADNRKNKNRDPQDNALLSEKK